MRNINADDLKKYLEIFHETYIKTAEQFLPEEVRNLLNRKNLLPSKIIGIVSTQFGVAFKYEIDQKISIKVFHGSRRIEDLLLNAPKKVSELQPMFIIKGSKCGIFSLTLKNAFPFRLENISSSLILGDMLFEALGWTQYIKYAEVYGNRSKEFWSIEKAVSRAKDEILAAFTDYYLATKREISIEEYINNFKEKAVLVLGSYSLQGKERLKRISEILKEHNYEPYLLKDIPDNPYQDLRQKVTAIASVVRFIIVDDIEPSGHLVELQLCNQGNWVTIVLRPQGIGPSFMARGFSITSKVFKEIEYLPDKFEDSLLKGIQWAESKIKELRKNYQEIYPWRRK